MTVGGSTRNLDVHFRRRHRVRWQETDAAGTVHFANYVRMMEETEYAFLRSLQLSIVTRDQRGVIGFPRISTDVQILNPARADEELDIWLSVSLNDGVKIEYRFEVARVDPAAGQVVATGRFLIACCRFPPGEPPRAILLPDDFRDRLPAVSS